MATPTSGGVGGRGTLLDLRDDVRPPASSPCCSRLRLRSSRRANLARVSSSMVSSDALGGRPVVEWLRRLDDDT